MIENIEETDVSFTVTAEAKQKYFEKRFKILKEIMSEMTLERFAQDGTDILFLVEDEYGEAVCLDGNFLSLDYFIRISIPKIKYYIGNVVYMH